MGQKIYVGNIGDSITTDDLISKFSLYGKVDSASIVMDRETGKSKGFGFVEMSNQEETENVIEALDGSLIEGRPMRVSVAKPLERRDSRNSK